MVGGKRSVLGVCAPELGQERDKQEWMIDELLFGEYLKKKELRKELSLMAITVAVGGLLQNYFIL